MNSVLQQFSVKKNTVPSDFVKKIFDKTKTFGIHVTSMDNTERVQPITCDAKHGLGRLDIRQREETASAATGHVWYTDCESLFAHLSSPDKKRFAIDLSALKQFIWDNRGDRDEEVDGSKGIRWIDTSAMPLDCLTKTMTSCRLNETLSIGIFDMSRHQKPKAGSVSRS